MVFEFSLDTNYAVQIMTMENVLKQDFAGAYILIKLFKKILSHQMTKLNIDCRSKYQCWLGDNHTVVI